MATEATACVPRSWWGSLEGPSEARALGGRRVWERAHRDACPPHPAASQAGFSCVNPETGLLPSPAISKSRTVAWTPPLLLHRD